MTKKINENDRRRINSIASPSTVGALAEALAVMRFRGYSESRSWKSLAGLSKALNGFERNPREFEKAVRYYGDAVNVLGEKDFYAFILQESRLISPGSEAIGIKCRIHNYIPFTREERQELERGKAKSYAQRPNRAGESMDPLQEIIFARMEG